MDFFILRCFRTYLALICFSLSFFNNAQTKKDSLQQVLNSHIQETEIFTRTKLEVDKDKLIKLIDEQPSFGIFRDLFFVSGIPLNRKIDKNSADAMFQISVRQRITKSVLPFNSFLFFTYSQKSFWDIYAKSSPFKDNNYNPGLGIGKYIIKDNQLLGIVYAQLEHESNGKSEDEGSRSWNFLSISAKYFFNYRLSFNIRLWAPIVGDDNKDLLDYRGLGYIGVNHITKDNRWWFTGEINPRKNLNINTTATAAYRISKKSDFFLFGRLFMGYGDSLLDYNKYEANLRIGIAIKPNFYSLY